MDEEKRILQLRKELLEHNRNYYDNDAPTISDYEYDMLMHELRSLEAKHPEMYDPNSPTVKVGGTSSSKFSKFTHKVPLQSLIDVFDVKEVEAWVKEVQATYPNATFSVEAKIDGLSLAVTYDNGHLVMGATRGNGLIGEDVTENVKCIGSIPTKIPEKKHTVFRGEVYMPKKVLERLNEERIKNGEQPFANCRNAAAGTLRQKDPKEVLDRQLSCMIFNIQENSVGLTTHCDGLEYAKAQGMLVTPYTHVTTAEDVVKTIGIIGSIRDTLSYDMDGAVVKVNELDIREKLGVTAKYPKWAIAYKYPPEERTTVVRDIKLQVGRTGVITPKAVFDTVQLCGTNVSAATLHNFDMLKSLDVRIGDTVRVYKAGEIIPKVTSVVMEKRPASAVPFEIPTKCPICGGPVEKDEDGVALRCMSDTCPAKFHRRLVHFVHRDAMNIDGIGKQTLEQMCDTGMVTKYEDLYKLTKDQLMTLDKVGDKKAENILSAIEASRKVKLANFLYAFGVPLFGHKATELVADKYKTLDKVLTATEEDMAKIPGVGEAIAKSACSYLKANKAEVEALGALMNIEAVKEKKVSMGNYTGKKCVITGTFDSHSRNEIQAALEAQGAVVAGSVSKNTDILFCGHDAGSKLQKAKELGVEIHESVDDLF